MNRELIENPDLVLAEVRGFTDALYRALELGCAAADEHFRLRGLSPSVDKMLHASIVRSVAKVELRKRGHDAEDDDERWEMADIANSGLKSKVKRFLTRVRKADPRTVGDDDTQVVMAPSPGDSSIMQAFYCQAYTQTLLPFFGVVQIEMNLLFLWTYGAAGVELYASCPAHGGNSRNSVIENWWRKIPHPADEADAAPPPPDSPDSLYHPRDEEQDADDTGTDD